jgi:membrane-associated phospholipid phosphatase
MEINPAQARPSRSARARRAMHCAAWALLAGPAVAMAASVPWTPSIAGRHAIELLVDDAGLALTVTQWPLPRDAVQQAIDALPADLSPSLEAARDQVRAELRRQRLSQATITLREHEDAVPGFGDDATPGSSLELRTAELDGPHLAMQLGGRLDPAGNPASSGARARLDDSAVAIDAYGVQLQAWAHRSWWGPGWQSALPLSNNAPALNGIGLQRASASASESPWLSWLGPWSVDFFLARSEGPERGAGAKPLISGTRFTMRPFSNLELGVTRMVQFGGSGRQETLNGFLNALRGVHENADTPSLRALDSGNGLAGYDARLRCPAGLRCAVYGQFIGEDEAGYLPSKYLNLGGAEFWSADGGDRFYVEASELACRVSLSNAPIRGCAYRNYAFPYGYASDDRWLGASVGPDSRLLTFGWIDAVWESSLRIDLGRVGSRIGTFDAQSDGSTAAGRLLGLSARRTFHWGPARLTPEFDWNRVATTVGVHVESRIGVEMSVALDDLGAASPSHFGEMLSLSRAGNSSATTKLLAATALVGGAALLDRAGGNYARGHRSDPGVRVLRDAGAGLPFVEFGLAGAAWLVQRGSPQGDIAFASLESGLAAVAIAEATKLAVDRSRPSNNRGAADFGHEKRSASSFPSIHSALAWGVVTPIAQKYDAPWLYGVAALTNYSRVAGRQHWLSDTVAGSVLGYVVGDWFASGLPKADGTSSTVTLVPHGVTMSMTFR